MVSKATKSKDKLHPWSRKAKAIPDTRRDPVRASRPGTAMEMSVQFCPPARSGCPGSRTQAAVAVVHQEVSSQGSRSEVVHTASPVGHVTHHHHFGLCEPVGVEMMGQ